MRRAVRRGWWEADLLALLGGEVVEVDLVEVSGLVGVADEGVGAVGDEVGVAGGAHRGQVGDVVGAAPGAGSEVVDLESVAAATDLTAADRVAAPPARSWGTGRGKRFPIAIGVPSSSTSTGSMVALARSCSNTESAIGTPAISAGPVNGTCVCTTGRGAMRRGLVLRASGCSHSCTRASAARCSKLSHAWPLAGFLCSVSRWIVASNVAPSTSGNWPCRCSMPLSGVHHIRNDRASYRARESSVDGFDRVARQTGPARPAPRSVPAAPTPHRRPRRPAW